MKNTTKEVQSIIVNTNEMRGELKMGKNRAENEFQETIRDVTRKISREEEKAVIAREYKKILDLAMLLNCAAGGAEHEYFAGKETGGPLDYIGTAVECFGELIDESAKFVGTYVQQRLRSALGLDAGEYEARLAVLGKNIENFWRDAMRKAFVDSDYGSFFQDDLPGTVESAVVTALFKGDESGLDGSKLKISSAVDKHKARERKRVEGLQRMFAEELRKVSLEERNA